MKKGRKNEMQKTNFFSSYLVSDQCSLNKLNTIHTHIFQQFVEEAFRALLAFWLELWMFLGVHRLRF